MLKPGVIPHKEPEIRVGIVLPEDKMFTISIRIPSDTHAIVENDNRSFTADMGSDLNFEVSKSIVLCPGRGEANKWKISLPKQQRISPGSGIIVKNVTAGRGFHWQKKIDVHLPGKVELSIHKDHILVINELPLEHYLMCVATSEMGAQCPDALIEAQTIVARSWLLANVEKKHIALGMDVCNDDCCQRYQGTDNLSEQSIRGADRTRGLTLIYNDQICDARYSKSCGGVMETFSTIWGGADLPYLQGLADAERDFSHPALPLTSELRLRQWLDDIPACFCSPHVIDEGKLSSYLGSVDESGTYFRWTVEYSQEEITSLLNNTLDLNARSILDIQTEGRGSSGRMIACRIDFIDSKQKKRFIKIKRDVAIRAALHRKFLYSSCFYTEIKGDTDVPDRFILTGAGWGHGVGLCQIGALGMGLLGYDSRTITQHYYPGSELKKLYD